MHAWFWMERGWGEFIRLPVYDRAAVAAVVAILVTAIIGGAGHLLFRWELGPRPKQKGPITFGDVAGPEP